MTALPPGTASACDVDARSLRAQIAADPGAAYEKVLGEPPGKLTGGEAYFRCPFHGDAHPSLRVRLQGDRAGLWRCDPCNKGGDLFDLVEELHECPHFPEVLQRTAQVLANAPSGPKAPRPGRAGPLPAPKPPPPTEAMVQDWAAALQAQASAEARAAYRYLLEERLLTPDTVQRAELGFAHDQGQNDVVFPVRAPEGTLRCAKFMPLPRRDGAAKYRYVGSSETTIYDPLGAIAGPADTLVACEGELDALLLNQHGVPAFCTTGGSGKWPKTSAPNLRGKTVIVLGDADAAGEQHTAALPPKLLEAGAGRIRVARWPDTAPPKCDPTDWLHGGHSIDSLAALLDQAEDWGEEPSDPEADSRPSPAPESQPHIAQLHEAGSSYRRYKRARDGWELETISNFLLLPRERLVMPNGEEVLRAELAMVGRKPRAVDLPHTALLSRNDLLRALGSTEAAWLGSDRDVMLLREQMRRYEVPCRQGVGVLGRHDDLIALPGLTIGREGPMLEESPPRLVVRHDSEFVRSVTARYPARNEHEAAARAVYGHCPRANLGRVIAPALAWTFALPWCALIRVTAGWGGFPHLVLWGSPGGGKTETARLLWRICGMPLSAEPFTLPLTRFTRVCTLSCTNLVPVLLDEYRTGTWSSHELNAIHHELRSAYGGEAESRGKPNLSVESFRLTAPVVLCGEDRPRDAALDHRIISLNLCKTTLEDADRKEAFRSASSEPLEAFALPYWAWSLGQEDWLDELAAARRWTETWAQTACARVPDRILNNLSILRFGWTMFGRYADHLGLTPAALVADSFETALLAVVLEVAPEGAARSGLDDLVSILHAMAANGRIRHDQHFGQTQEGHVLLPLHALLPEARRYARETAAPTQLMGLDSYRQQIAEAGKQPGSYVAEASGRAYIAGKRRRGVLVDPEILESRLQLDADVWDAPDEEGWVAARDSTLAQLEQKRTASFAAGVARAAEADGEDWAREHREVAQRLLDKARQRLESAEPLTCESLRDVAAVVDTAVKLRRLIEGQTTDHQQVTNETELMAALQAVQEVPPDERGDMLRRSWARTGSGLAARAGGPGPVGRALPAD